jgi:hypothetical protein
MTYGQNRGVTVKPIAYFPHNLPPVPATTIDAILTLPTGGVRRAAHGSAAVVGGSHHVEA